jgi:glycosyltransferase involved in cell wall biosynthesis
MGRRRSAKTLSERLGVTAIRMSTRRPSPLLFFDFVTHYGGSNRSTVGLAGRLQRFAPVLVADAYGACPEYLADLGREGVRIEVLDPDATNVTIGGKGTIGRGWRLARSVPHLARVALCLKRLVRRERPRLLWVNSPKALFLVARVIGPRTPLAWCIRGQYSGIPEMLKRDWARVSAAIGVSQAAVDHLRQLGFPGRIELVHNGIDVCRVVERSGSDPGSLPGSDNELRLVMPASLIPLKNHTMAIRGLAEHARRGGRARLWICGDVPNTASDPFVDNLLELPQRLGVADRVHFLGWHDNVPAVLARADVMALTSNSEGLPVSVLEAMALGKPVLATAVGGTGEAVRDGIDGILLRPDDAQGFAEALDRLRDTGTRLRMGQAGRARVEAEFSLTRQVERFHHVLCDVVEGRENPEAAAARSETWARGSDRIPSAPEGREKNSCPCRERL